VGSSATLSIADDGAGIGAGNALQLISSDSFSRATASFPSEAPIADTGAL